MKRSFDGSLVPRDQHPLTAAAMKNVYRKFIRLGCVVCASFATLAAYLRPSWAISYFQNLRGSLANIPANLNALLDTLDPRHPAFYAAVFVLTYMALSFVYSVILKLWLSKSNPFEEFLAPFASSSVPVINPAPDGYTVLAPTEDDNFIFERQSQLEQLLSFAEGSERYAVAMLSGPSGIGKTRLAMEWAKCLRTRTHDTVADPGQSVTVRLISGLGCGRKWEAGFVTRRSYDELRTEPDMIEGWRPLGPTALVIDTTDIVDSRTARLIEDILFRASVQFIYPVRLLIICYESLNLLDQEIPRRGWRGVECSIELPALGTQGVRSVLQSSRSYAGQLSETFVEDALNQSGGRPFLVRLMTLLPSDRHPNPVISDKTLDPCSILRRYAYQIFDQAKDGVLSTDPPLSLQHGLAVATLAGSLNTSSYVGLNLPQNLTAFKFKGNDLLGVSPPLLAISYLRCVSGATNEATLKSDVAARAWRERPQEVSAFILSYWWNVARNPLFSNIKSANVDDRAEWNPQLHDPEWLRPIEELPDGASTVTRAIWLLTKLQIRGSPRFSDADRDRDDTVLAPEEMKALERDNDIPTACVLASHWASQAKSGDLDAWRKLTVVFRYYPDVQLIQRSFAVALHGAIKSMGEMADRDGVEAAINMMKLVPSSGEEDRSTRLGLAVGLTEAVSAYSEQSAVASAEAAFEELVKLSRRYQEDEDVLKLLSFSASSLGQATIRESHWTRVAEVSDKLSAIAAASRHPEWFDDNILCLLAVGVSLFGKELNPMATDRMEPTEQRIAEIVSRHPDTPHIQQFAMTGLASLAGYYAHAASWTKLSRVVCSVMTTSRCFPGNDSIQSGALVAIAFAYNAYSIADNIEDMGRIECWLEELATALPTEIDVQKSLVAIVDAAVDQEALKVDLGRSLDLQRQLDEVGKERREPMVKRERTPERLEALRARRSRVLLRVSPSVREESDRGFRVRQIERNINLAMAMAEPFKNLRNSLDDIRKQLEKLINKKDESPE